MSTKARPFTDDYDYEDEDEVVAPPPPQAQSLPPKRPQAQARPQQQARPKPQAQQVSQVQQADWDEEEAPQPAGILATPGRAIALGLSALLLLVVFSLVIFLMSSRATPGTTISGSSSNNGSVSKVGSLLPTLQTNNVPVITGFNPATAAESQAPAKGAYAPDFMWKDTDGKTVALSSFRGNKPLFVNFWGTWCPPCRSEMPAMETFSQQHQNDIQVLSVSMGPRDDPAGVLNFIKAANYGWKFVHDGDYNVATRYEVGSVPSSYFIDKNGIIKAVQIGAMTPPMIESYLLQVK